MKKGFSLKDIVGITVEPHVTRRAHYRILVYDKSDETHLIDCAKFSPAGMIIQALYKSIEQHIVNRDSDG